ncbi:MAG: LysR family transcriptional regulator, partial [Ruminococcus sp.]|nr:LysR family transcriptional regulator [Ruminococcus sp.]
KDKIRFEDLKDYPCLSFEQGDKGSFYYAEEILSTSEYPKTIRATDRATMLNLMIGLNGYTLCSGVISEELNGSDYLAVPFTPDEDTVADKMLIGYISKKNLLLSHIAQLYVKELEQYLCSYQESHK